MLQSLTAAGDLSGQRVRVCAVIANRLKSPLIKERIRVLQPFMAANRALAPRSCPIHSNLQGGPEQDQITRHLLRDLVGRVHLRRRDGKVVKTRKPNARTQ